MFGEDPTILRGDKSYSLGGWVGGWGWFLFRIRIGLNRSISSSPHICQVNGQNSGNIILVIVVVAIVAESYDITCYTKLNSLKDCFKINKQQSWKF